MHESANAPGVSSQPVQVGSEYDDGDHMTPDLSPRGDSETEDPPTPRMYKAIVPTAPPGPVQRPAKKCGNDSRLKPESSQIVLHQGHYEHSPHHASPGRHTLHKEQEEAIGALRRTLRYALRLCPCCRPALMQLCIESLAFVEHIVWAAL